MGVPLPMGSWRLWISFRRTSHKKTPWDTCRTLEGSTRVPGGGKHAEGQVYPEEHRLAQLWLKWKHGTSKELFSFQQHNPIHRPAQHPARRQATGRKTRGPQRKSVAKRNPPFTVWRVWLDDSQMCSKSFSHTQWSSPPRPRCRRGSVSTHWSFSTHQDWPHLTENQEGCQLNVFAVAVLQRNRSKSCRSEKQTSSRQISASLAVPRDHVPSAWTREVRAPCWGADFLSGAQRFPPPPPTWWLGSGAAEHSPDCQVQLEKWSWKRLPSRNAGDSEELKPTEHRTLNSDPLQLWFQSLKYSWAQKTQRSDESPCPSSSLSPVQSLGRASVFKDFQWEEVFPSLGSFPCWSSSPKSHSLFVVRTCVCQSFKCFFLLRERVKMGLYSPHPSPVSNV